MKHDRSPELPGTPKLDHAIDHEATPDIRCTCGRLLARQTADGTAIEIRCPRCKRTWTFPLPPTSLKPTER